MGFSAEWLALREPADHAARNGDVLAAVQAYFADKDSLSIVDLGCGAGSNLRGFALALPASRQQWTLVDYDLALLAAARERLVAWADHAHEQGEELVLEKADKTLTVDFRQVDLNADLAMVIGWRPDLVTAAALFDLVSEPWIATFVAALAQEKLPLYTVLTYDGRETWLPHHEANGRVHAAFLGHQLSDKGFGPAAGPGAADALVRHFHAAGYNVATGDSFWKIDAYGAPLAQQLVDGIATAVGETGRIAKADLKAWADFRRGQLRSRLAVALVGHTDLFATP